MSGIEWSPVVIPYFAGHLDGQGYTLFGMQGTTHAHGGLFGMLAESSVVTQLGMVDANWLGIGETWRIGLLAAKNKGLISRCAIQGRVSGGRMIGGIVGHHTGILENSYAQVIVEGAIGLGGVTGSNNGLINMCYCSGAISGQFSVGAFTGSQWGIISQCMWNTEISSELQSIGSIGWQIPEPETLYGLTIFEMQQNGIFMNAGWDFTDTWMICEGQDYPRLRWEGLNVMNSKEYDGGINRVILSGWNSHGAKRKCQGCVDCPMAHEA